LLCLVLRRRVRVSLESMICYIVVPTHSYYHINGPWPGFCLVDLGIFVGYLIFGTKD